MCILFIKDKSNKICINIIIEIVNTLVYNKTKVFFTKVNCGWTLWKNI